MKAEEKEHQETFYGGKALEELPPKMEHGFFTFTIGKNAAAMVHFLRRAAVL